MLETMACRLIYEPSPQLVITALDMCLMRYDICRPLIVRLVNNQLHRLTPDTEPLSLDDAVDADTLMEKLGARLRPYIIEKKKRLGRMELQRGIAEAAYKMMLAALLAALDYLGVRCPINSG